MTADTLTINGVEIEDTFAEAFTMRGARVIITAATPRWARVAATVMTGFATSVIGCKVEAGIEHEVSPDDTPDGRPGISVLVFTPDSAGLQQRLIERLGQTVLTCPTTAVFDGIPSSTDRMPVGKALRIFGDGFQASKLIGGIRYWRVPVMEGEALIQETFGKVSAVGGGNFLMLAETAEKALQAAEAAVAAMMGLPGVILPFPGGIVRSGSKVGSRRYKTLLASTNDAFAPTLREITTTDLPEGVNGVMEIVLDGLDFDSISRAMRAGIPAACIPGVKKITAGNYGGKLGPHHFYPAEDRRMTLVLTLRPGITERIDASAMATNSTCWVGRRRVSVGEIFDVKGEPSPDVRITGDLRRVDGLGTGMSAGTLTIEGEAGRGVGHAMSGGTIDVTGSVGDGAGVAMSGGLLRIRGSAGDRLGAPLPGASRGMTGGEIIVRGNVGNGAATRVRRGLVIVGGNAGPNAAHAMIAGTMLVAGRLGAGAGLWSKRGSVIALGGLEVPATYRYACTYRPPYVPVLLRYLQRMRGFTIDGRFATGRYKRWTGDVADVGKGEILEWTT